MCGVLGIYSHKPVAQELYDGLIHLQHRGQDAAGILTYDDRFHIKKGGGYVRDIFDQDSMNRLTGAWGLGHTRYPTVGTRYAIEDAQPFMVAAPYGIGMCHNGDVVNYTALKKELFEDDRRVCNSGCDVEVILNVLAAELAERCPVGDNFFDYLCAGVDRVFDRVSGGYSACSIIAGKGMLVFRDPHGIRPFVRGSRQNADGTRDYIFSSENTMYYPLGFKLDGDVQPGEVIFIDAAGVVHNKILRSKEFTPDAFEYIYLARPDSTLNGISVYRSRLHMGQNLGKRWKERFPTLVPDVVVPVPFSSNTAALAMAHELGVRYSEGIYKNPFVGRTFIMPGQEKRRKSVLQKLSPQETEIRDKIVLLVDDSIVRGTTSKEVVRLVRDAGATKVYFASACPPVKFPDFYGIDLPTRAELVAAHLSEEEIQRYIGADALLFQTKEDLVEAIVRKGGEDIERLSMPYLDGWYVTGDIDLQKIESLEKEKGVEHFKVPLTV